LAKPWKSKAPVRMTVSIVDQSPHVRPNVAHERKLRSIFPSTPPNLFCFEPPPSCNRHFQAAHRSHLHILICCLTSNDLGLTLSHYIHHVVFPINDYLNSPAWHPRSALGLRYKLPIRLAEDLERLYLDATRKTWRDDWQPTTISTCQLILPLSTRFPRAYVS
jgi:hypothetical protein